MLQSHCLLGIISKVNSNPFNYTIFKMCFCLNIDKIDVRTCKYNMVFFETLAQGIPRLFSKGKAKIYYIFSENTKKDSIFFTKTSKIYYVKRSIFQTFLQYVVRLGNFRTRWHVEGFGFFLEWHILQKFRLIGILYCIIVLKHILAFK